MYLYCYLVILGVSWTGQRTNVTATNTQGGERNEAHKPQQRSKFRSVGGLLFILFCTVSSPPVPGTRAGDAGMGPQVMLQGAKPRSSCPLQGQARPGASRGPAAAAPGCHHLRGFSSASLPCRTSFCTPWHARSSTVGWQGAATGSRARGLQAGMAWGLKLGIFRFVTVLCSLHRATPIKFLRMHCAVPGFSFMVSNCCCQAEESLEIIKSLQTLAH